MSKIILLVVLIIVAVFLGPYIVLLGWNCAREMWPQLPVATYHHAFWITNGIMILFKSTSTSKK